MDEAQALLIRGEFIGLREKIDKLQEKLELQNNLLEQISPAYLWMFKSLKHNEDQLNAGNYSDEMKHTIIIKEALDIWRDQNGTVQKVSPEKT